MRTLAANPRNVVALKNLGHPRQGRRRRQPAGSLLSAPLLRDRSPGPADRVRPRLCLYGAGRHGAGPEAFPGGAGDGGTRGAARSGQEWALEDCGPRAQGPWATHGCGLLSAGCHAAVSREVAETIILILAAHLLPQWTTLTRL